MRLACGPRKVSPLATSAWLANRQEAQAGARPAKVFAAGHQCMAGEQAGVPGARAPPGPRPQFHVVGDIIAVARGTDHAATAAGEALLSQLLPDLALVFHLEDLGKVADLHLELERAALVPGAPLVVVDIGSVHRLEEAAGGEDHVVAQRRAHQSL